VHTHGASLINIAKEVKYYMDCNSDDTIFWITDLGWMMGPWYILGGNCLSATVFLYNGAMDYPHREDFWTIVERNGITLLGLSPTLVRSLKHSGEGRRIRGVRVFGSTGEPWDEDSWMWLFRELGGSEVPISNISGGTDIFGCFLATTPAHPLMPRSLFRGLGMKVSVFSEGGREVYDEVGYLVATGHLPSMTRGIWKTPEKYISTYWKKFNDAWVQGDWATMDREGYFFILGRTDDVIKIAGKRLGPGEVENEVLLVPGVTEAAAVGVDDEIKGSSLVVFYSGTNSDDTVLRIKDKILDSVGKSFLPRHVIWVPVIPKTRNGKILRRVIKMAFMNHDLGDTSNLDNVESLEYLKEVGKAYGY
jgi:acetyl-CoA synthetase